MRSVVGPFPGAGKTCKSRELLQEALTHRNKLEVGSWRRLGRATGSGSAQTSPLGGTTRAAQRAAIQSFRLRCCRQSAMTDGQSSNGCTVSDTPGTVSLGPSQPVLLLLSSVMEHRCKRLDAVVCDLELMICICLKIIPSAKVAKPALPPVPRSVFCMCCCHMWVSVRSEMVSEAASCPFPVTSGFARGFPTLRDKG